MTFFARFMSTCNDATQIRPEVLPYPLSPENQAELVGLLRTEWARTDYDWLEAMNGDYGARLAISSIVARIAGRAVATATLHHSRDNPEIGVIGNVLTRRDHRGRGLAGDVLEVAVELGVRAGCAICLLGTAKRPRNVYLRHGFSWQAGVVMRRPLAPGNFEARYFENGQPAAARSADWGDLPGLTLLASQPLLSASLDYPRGLVSARYVPPERCLSNFPSLWYDTVPRGGALVVLAEPRLGRIFGFGSVTLSPGAGQRHAATLDLVAHENHESRLPELLDFLLKTSGERGIQTVRAFLAPADQAKLRCMLERGFSEIARLPGALRLNPSSSDVIVLQRSL